jgi:hypothetical protein
VEGTSTVLAVTCVFLSALYAIFAVSLFSCYASETVLSKGHHNHRGDHHDHRENGIKALPPVPVNAGDQHQHQRHAMDDDPGFIGRIIAWGTRNEQHMKQCILPHMPMVFYPTKRNKEANNDCDSGHA